MDKENVYLYTMKYYPAIKKMSFAGKWVELEIIV
jgi:hypothetical protein